MSHPKSGKKTDCTDRHCMHGQVSPTASQTLGPESGEWDRHDSGTEVVTTRSVGAPQGTLTMKRFRTVFIRCHGARVQTTATSFVCVCVCVLPPSVSNPTCRSKPLFGNVFGACMHCTVGEGSDDDEGLNVLRCRSDIYQERPSLPLSLLYQLVTFTCYFNPSQPFS